MGLSIIQLFFNVKATLSFLIEALGHATYVFLSLHAAVLNTEWRTNLK